MNDLLIVYNIFGKRDNSAHYIKCVESILNSKISCGFKVVISACLSHPTILNKLFQHFGDKIGYVVINKPYTVNITFNKTVQECVKSMGEFNAYLYVDSGIDFIGNEYAIQAAYNLLTSEDRAMVSFQVENDHALYNVGINDFPLKDKNHVVPIGTACNGHSEMFSNHIYKKYNNKLIPDVFAAYCTESTYSFLCAGVGRRWVILGDYVLHHAKSVDGASSTSPHMSQVHLNTWNNLLFGRDARIFVNDQDAINSGLGYEECNSIMLHKKECYSDLGDCLNPDPLAVSINKYFYLTKEELDYDSI